MAQYMADILDPEDRDKLYDNLLVGQAKVPMDTFLIRFQWDGAKFPLRQPLPNIVDVISKVGFVNFCTGTCVCVYVLLEWGSYWDTA